MKVRVSLTILVVGLMSLSGCGNGVPKFDFGDAISITSADEARMALTLLGGCNPNALVPRGGGAPSGFGSLENEKCYVGSRLVTVWYASSEQEFFQRYSKQCLRRGSSEGYQLLWGKSWALAGSYLDEIQDILGGSIATTGEALDNYFCVGD